MIDNTDLIIHLRESGLIDDARLKRGLQLAEEHDLSLYMTLIQYGLVEEHDVVRIASRVLNVPSINLQTQKIEQEVLERVASSLAYRNNVLPLRILDEREGSLLLLAMADPFDMLAMDEIAGHTGVHIRPILVGPVDLLAALDRVYKKRESQDVFDFGLTDPGLEDESSIPLFTGTLPAESAVDSWAKLYDTAQSVGIEEDSAVISQEMRDRPPTDVFESMYFEDPPPGDLSVSSALAAHIKEAGPRVKISLDEWELDSAFTQNGAVKNRVGLLSSDSIVEEDEKQSDNGTTSKPFPQLSPSDGGSTQLGRIQIKRIAVPVEEAKKKVHRDEQDVFSLDSVDSEVLLRATVQLLMKKGIFTLDELMMSLKSE